MPTTLSVLTNVFPAEERAKAIGIWAAVAGLGVAIGPVAGGALLERFEWASVFIVNLPVVAIGIAGAMWLVPESRDPEHSALDPLGAGLSIAGLSALVWGIIEAGGGNWGDPKVVAALGAGAVLLFLFARWELRAPSPMLDVRLFRNGAFSGASGSIALVFFALFGAIFFLTQYLQGVLDYTALEAGVRTLPVAGGLIVGGPLSAKIAERVGSRLVVAAGLTISATGLGLLAMVDVDSGYGLVAASMAVLGIGMGASMAPATESIMSVLPEAHAGVGAAMNDTTRMVGGSLGIAVLGSLLSSGYGAGMERATEGLPAGAADAAQNSLGGASVVADRIGGVALAGAVLAFTLMPGKSRAARVDPVAEPVPA